MPPPTLQILVVGDTSRPEFRETCTALGGGGRRDPLRRRRVGHRRAGRLPVGGGGDRAGPVPPRSVLRRGDRPPPRQGPSGPADCGAGKLVRRRAAERPSLAGCDSHVLAPGGRSHPPGIFLPAPESRFHHAAAGHRDGRRAAAGLDRGAVGPGQGTGGDLDSAAGNGGPACRRVPEGRLLDGLAAPMPAGPGARCGGGNLRWRCDGCRRFRRAAAIRFRRGARGSRWPCWTPRGSRTSASPDRSAPRSWPSPFASTSCFGCWQDRAVPVGILVDRGKWAKLY